MKNLFSGSVPKRLLPLLAILLLPTLAHAHPASTTHTHGLTNGLAHPLIGLDHLCAMIAVGLWAAQRGGRSLWLIPLSFVSLMFVSGMVGIAGVSMPFVEQGIAASVLVLGLLIATAVRLPLAAGALLVGLFAIFHGHAHGAEMPTTASGFGYGLGFMISTAALHLCGIGLGFAGKQIGNAQFVRYAGGAIAACGVYLCVI